jgi:hypothetical protein
VQKYTVLTQKKHTFALQTLQVYHHRLRYFLYNISNLLTLSLLISHHNVSIVKARITGTTNISKITKSMKMVSAAKLRGDQTRLAAAKPFAVSYTRAFVINIQLLNHVSLCELLWFFQSFETKIIYSPFLPLIPTFLLSLFSLLFSSLIPL